LTLICNNSLKRRPLRLTDGLHSKQEPKIPSPLRLIAQ
jgi:hypothetical protein